MGAIISRRPNQQKSLLLIFDSLSAYNHDVEFRELRSLAALAESGSILCTAADLHLSPAAVHKHIKNLETELGVRLYEKVGRRLQITPAAEVVLPHLNVLLAEYEALLTSLGEWKGLRAGRVRIGTGPTLCSCMLPMLLKGFRRKYPTIDLLVETGNSETLLERFDKRALDLLLMVWPEYIDRGTYSLERLWPFEITLVSHSRSTHPMASLADLKRQPFILFQKGSRIEDLIDRYFAAMDFTPRTVMRFDNAEAIKAMLESGSGISMLPYWTVSKEVQEGRLFVLRQREKPLVSSIALVGRRASHDSQPVNAFIQFARTFENRRLRLTSRAVSP